ncbi:TetR/AcrR family transcriptional regulator [Sinirhodobacter sp. WL0062]|uniref:TetR/AcrR family transcriptional regulator n=1 Tax=Rhodobacter flavimaris TaxID=2907145 RepID=A0ABS8YTE5_9RHOB|nr:TetR/AcrR family transcriptional regulator [Sinirhodobacter sp. WL0062]MCE5973137.1 TetR/AcrR family transcriptional regulator [Sinirhodobacter sp. WL0062]
MNTAEPPAEGRVARRQRLVREALIRAARAIMSEKGVDGATMLEIAERADVGAGTVYNYFKSKDELAVAVLEEMMSSLAVRIERVTDTFDDPAQVYAYGIRTVLEAATRDIRWRQLLNRSEVLADAMYRRMGPYAIRDLQQATAAGRFHADDAELIWRMACHAIIGVSLAITLGEMSEEEISSTVVRLLCTTGIGIDAARELAHRHRPDLSPEGDD